METETLLGPQFGPQTKFLSTEADICVYGGAAGGGKTFGLLLEPLRHIENKDFGAVIFRRTSPQIRNEGGLWDESAKIYPQLKGRPRESILEWEFPSGARVKFAHMQHDQNRFDWQGSQIPMIGFDELTHFTKSQFFYMLSRSRSVCGVAPYIRATCNPDPDHWLREFLDFWIDRESGLPIPERDGVVRYFVRRGDNFVWGDSPEDVISRQPDADLTDCRSVTFIAASIYDNQILLEQNPEYLGNLKALPRVEREQLLGGNWNVRPAAGMYFRREFFRMIPEEQVPRKLRIVRYWDRAGTRKTDDKKGKDPDYTAGVKMGIDRDGIIYILDVRHFRGTPLEVKKAIKAVATQDGRTCRIGLEQEPGASGIYEKDDLIRYLRGFIIRAEKVERKKEVRAAPFSAYCEGGNVRIVNGFWNNSFLNELENFPDGENDDQVDSASGAFRMLVGKQAGPNIKALASL